MVGRPGLLWWSSWVVIMGSAGWGGLIARRAGGGVRKHRSPCLHKPVLGQAWGEGGGYCVLLE